MENFKRIEWFRYSDDEAPDIERDVDDVLTSSEISCLAFYAEHPELVDPLIGLLPEQSIQPRDYSRRIKHEINDPPTRFILRVKTKEHGKESNTLIKATCVSNAVLPF